MRCRLVGFNRDRYKGINGYSKLLAGTELKLCKDDDEEMDRKPLPDDTPSVVAARHSLPLNALLSINKPIFGDDLKADTPLFGKAMRLRDRDNEVSFEEYLLPKPDPEADRKAEEAKKAAAAAAEAAAAAAAEAAAAAAAEASGASEAAPKAGQKRKRGGDDDGDCEVAEPAESSGGDAKEGGSSANGKGGKGGKGPGSKAKAAAKPKQKKKVAEPGEGLRQIDEDGAMTRRLAQQSHEGDPTKEGVVWPKIAELGLLVSLGGGGALLRFALQQLQREGWYEFICCQATLAAVGFYERVGFRRVGAVAKYAEKVTAAIPSPTLVPPHPSPLPPLTTPSPFLTTPHHSLPIPHHPSPPRAFPRRSSPRCQSPATSTGRVRIACLITYPLLNTPPPPTPAPTPPPPTPHPRRRRADGGGRLRQLFLPPRPRPEGVGRRRSHRAADVDGLSAGRLHA